eukprot:TRINITY_DN255_c0_g1_i2.p1 TRINITY_DN255_c0_g1~~TRINITY_DN255_c0_g1_i2.p1  ORF type:complete len:457 (+),score=115.48 TRINITY_DN255_c0_g1_i2:149-1372(+)
MTSSSSSSSSSSEESSPPPTNNTSNSKKKKRKKGKKRIPNGKKKDRRIQTDPHIEDSDDASDCSAPNSDSEDNGDNDPIHVEEQEEPKAIPKLYSSTPNKAWVTFQLVDALGIPCREFTTFIEAVQFIQKQPFVQQKIVRIINDTPSLIMGAMLKGCRTSEDVGNCLTKYMEEWGHFAESAGDDVQVYHCFDRKPTDEDIINKPLDSAPSSKRAYRRLKSASKQIHLEAIRKKKKRQWDYINRPSKAKFEQRKRTNPRMRKIYDHIKKLQQSRVERELDAAASAIDSLGPYLHELLLEAGETKQYLSESNSNIKHCRLSLDVEGEYDAMEAANSCDNTIVPIVNSIDSDSLNIIVRNPTGIVCHIVPKIVTKDGQRIKSYRVVILNTEHSFQLFHGQALLSTSDLPR